MTARIALFDLGNVVVDWEPARLYRQLMDADSAARFCEEVCTMEWHNAHDRGVSMVDNALPLIEKHPDKAELIRAWSSRWLDMFHGYVDGVPELITALGQRKIPLYALTNFPGEKWAETADAFPVLNDFADVVISSEVRMAKPDRAIYALTLERMGNPEPGEVFFTDDRQDNIDVASSVGMITHRFVTAAGLKAALTEHGLL
ncbi:MAG: HAD family hydrolase [Hirschia sp.]|nr:HAD family hydrolase [Hirschia sp.]MBF19171.1 HAD family hydrolase [Hirschia sp.]|tara:strand:- start:70 stop:675 length:606 start_codon:yes stop_codon:yes gene_type:complete